NESGFIIALLAGLLIGNCSTRACSLLKEAIRPELYIKAAIVILGGFLGIAALEQRALATSVMFLGACAIIARPVVPIMVSSLVVVFAVVELLVLPFAAQHFLYHQPLVAGAWMGLA